MTTPKTQARVEGTLDPLLAAARDWRWAEVNHAAIVLGMRVGDEQDARRAAELALNNLRIATDKAVAANDGGERQLAQKGTNDHT